MNVDRVWVAGQPFAIRPMHKESEEESLGLLYADQRLIFIRQNQNEISKRDSLLHETLHAIWHIASMEPSETEENCVSKIASLLLGVFDDPRNENWIKVVLKK